MLKKHASTKASEPKITSNPQTFDEFVESGWEHYSKKEYYRAEADFQKALEITPDHSDTMYALGMTQQASGRVQEAVHTFDRVIQLLQNEETTDGVREHMLVRLARGHINRMRSGNWELDK